MTATVLGASALMAMAALIGGAAYRHQWRRMRGGEVTPTGFGAFLSIFILISGAVTDAPASQLMAYGVVALATAVYWFDDAYGLGVRLRLALQFGVGAVVTGLILHSTSGADPGLLAGLCLAGGALNVVLTNVINFYDGADLNLGLLIGLTATSILVFGGHDAPLTAAAVFMLALVLPFGLYNRLPRNIYLGDSGSFAFASFLTIIAGLFLRSDNKLDALVSAPIALPLFDVFCVLVLRIRKGEDLLSRNYYHLYQRLQIERSGFGYLAPQPINCFFVIIIALQLRWLGFDTLFSAALSMIVVTPVFYFFCLYMRLKLPKVG